MPVDPQQAALEEQVGNPWERWRALINRVTGGAVQQFAAVEQEWLDLMWCLDAYRAAGVSPRRVGRRRDPSPEAANRWLASCDVLALLAVDRRLHGTFYSPYRSRIVGSLGSMVRSPAVASRALISSRWSLTSCFSASVIRRGSPACSSVA